MKLKSKIKPETPKEAKTHPKVKHGAPEEGRSGAPAERHQVAALPFRRRADGNVEVLLVTSREAGRFVLPKGWPMKRLSDPKAAAREAYEEAGVVGKVRRKPIGDYSYWKRLDDRCEFLRVEVYPLEVRGQAPDWPEKNARRCVWLSPKGAALLVDEPGLVSLLRALKR
jgi:8-oxo-dGTP pyrophosphatase MutT (NUDIX family)